MKTFKYERQSNYIYEVPREHSAEDNLRAKDVPGELRQEKRHAAMRRNPAFDRQRTKFRGLKMEKQRTGAAVAPTANEPPEAQVIQMNVVSEVYKLCSSWRAD